MNNLNNGHDGPLEIEESSEQSLSTFNGTIIDLPEVELIDNDDILEEHYTSSGSGNVEKIRDILFGSQMRDYERKFARLEERFIRETADIREDSKKRFETLETFIKSELASLSVTIRQESKQREFTQDEIMREIRDTSRLINQRIYEVDDRTTTQQRELRTQLLTQSKELTDEIRTKYEEIALWLANETRELRSEKADRFEIADLFAEISLRLNQEYSVTVNK